jgi:hypothetical protein
MYQNKRIETLNLQAFSNAPVVLWLVAWAAASAAMTNWGQDTAITEISSQFAGAR